MTSRRAGGPPSSAGLQDKRAESGTQGGRNSCGIRLLGRTPATEGGSGKEKRGANEGRDREVPGLGEAGGSPGNPDVRRAAGRRRERSGAWGKGQGQNWNHPGSGGLGGSRRPGFSKLGGDGGELSDSGANGVERMRCMLVTLLVVNRSEDAHPTHLSCAMYEVAVSSPKIIK